MLPQDGLIGMITEIDKAIKEAKLAYQFVPNSYTASALGAILQVDKTVRPFIESRIPPWVDYEDIKGGSEEGDRQS